VGLSATIHYPGYVPPMNVTDPITGETTWTLEYQRCELCTRRPYRNVGYEIRYEILDAILTCNQTLTRVSLIYCTELTTKQSKNRKKTLKSKKTGMLRSIGESV